jgi:hypothetical protein
MNTSQNQRTNLSVDKATRFCGVSLNDALKEKYGANCHYCKQYGNWYNNFQQFWDNVKNRLIDVPPGKFDAPQINYLTPARPQYLQACLRQLDIPEAHNGKILIVSGASTHVSGSLALFISKEGLAKPRKIMLAVTDCNVDVRFKGTIAILMSKGKLLINYVYYCPGVDGVILLVGWLTDVGWKLNFKGDNACLISPTSIVFHTIYRNYCWFLEMIQPQLKLNKVTHQPSFDPY